MAIAAINACVLSIESRISDIELDMMLIDQTRQYLNLQMTDLQTQYSTQYAQKQLNLAEDDLTNDQQKALDFDWESFKMEYAAATGRIQAHDKTLEMERTNLQTQKEELSTALESQEKRLQKNIEADMKGFN